MLQYTNVPLEIKCAVENYSVLPNCSKHFFLLEPSLEVIKRKPHLIWIYFHQGAMTPTLSCFVFIEKLGNSAMAQVGFSLVGGVPCDELSP